MRYKVYFDLSGAEAAAINCSSAINNAVAEVVRQTATGIRLEWQDAIMQALPRRDDWTIAQSNAAVDSITVTRHDPFSATVSSSDQDVFELEEGRPARDLKRMLQTSRKTKLSKAGKRGDLAPVFRTP